MITAEPPTIPPPTPNQTTVGDDVDGQPTPGPARLRRRA